MNHQKILVTRNYDLFDRSAENRPVDLDKHKKLFASMTELGFMFEFPIVVRQTSNGLIIEDGQHRFAVAQELGLPVYYVVTTADFDVAALSLTTKVWSPEDYAQKFAGQGIQDYARCIEFADKHKLPVAKAAAVLGGCCDYGNVKPLFITGKFRIKDEKWAVQVLNLYRPLVQLSAEVKNMRLMEACMGVCRVKGFDAERLLKSAATCREKLVSYSTKEAFLEMLEEIYNFRKRPRVALKVEAENAMRDRNPTKKKSK